MLQKLIMNVNLSVKGLKINLSTFQPYKSGLFTLIVCLSFSYGGSEIQGKTKTLNEIILGYQGCGK